MNENFFTGLPLESKERFSYIEGRQDLFETKILRIPKKNQSEPAHELLVASRDPGSGNALMPVLKELDNNCNLQIDLVTDGRAREIFQNNFQVEDVTPEGMILESDRVIGTPELILMDNSAEKGIDTYVASTFPEVPKILVEDYYGTAIQLISELIKRNLPLPEKICVMDQAAKELIVKRFPQLEDAVKITGQPAFDRFIEEDIEQITLGVKNKLGLKMTDKLVSFMATDEPQNTALLAESLKDVVGDFYFAFRRHPRDNVSYEKYEQIFKEAGIRIVNTNDLSTNEVGAASDIILTTWSTEGLHGIYRGKPTVHITDNNFINRPDLNEQLPPVKLGASAGLDNIREIKAVLPELLNSGSELNETLREGMAKYYPADGKNSKRVADIVRQYLK